MNQQLKINILLNSPKNYYLNLNEIEDEQQINNSNKKFRFSLLLDQSFYKNNEDSFIDIILLEIYIKNNNALVKLDWGNDNFQGLEFLIDLKYIYVFNISTQIYFENQYINEVSLSFPKTIKTENDKLFREKNLELYTKKPKFNFFIIENITIDDVFKKNSVLILCKIEENYDGNEFLILEINMDIILEILIKSETNLSKNIFIGPIFSELSTELPQKNINSKENIGASVVGAVTSSGGAIIKAGGSVIGKIGKLSGKIFSKIGDLPNKAIKNPQITAAVITAGATLGAGTVSTGVTATKIISDKKNAEIQKNQKEINEKLLELKYNTKTIDTTNSKTPDPIDSKKNELEKKI